MLATLSRRALMLGLAAAPAKRAWANFFQGALHSPTVVNSFVVASADGRSFVKSGSPWLMLCDSAQTMVNIFGSDITTYLGTRASQGFNAIQFDLVATGYVSAITPYAAQTAGSPVFAFANNGAITSSYVTNSSYWTLMDSYVAAINAQGMVAVLNPYEGNQGMTDLVAAGNTACFNFGVFLGNRYKTSDIIWHLGNDTDISSVAIYQAFLNLAQGILSVDTSHMMTIELFYSFSTTFEPNANGTFATVFGAKAINGAYTYGPTYGYTMIAYNGSGTSFGGIAGTNNVSPSPVIMLEANYVGENIRADGSTPITYRKQMWWLILAGCTGGYIFGTAWTWGFITGWASHLTDGVSDVQAWQTFINSIAYQGLKPDQARALATTGSSGWNTPGVTAAGAGYATDAYICMAADSLVGGAHLASAYFPQSSQSITVDLSKFAGTITAKWVDPTSGAKTTVSGSPFTNTGTHAFAPSGNNAAGDVDWALLLTA